MIFGRVTPDYSKFHNWFAWRPVQLHDGRWAWLEVIRRRYNYGGAFWKYEPIGVYSDES